MIQHRALILLSSALICAATFSTAHSQSDVPTEVQETPESTPEIGLLALASSATPGSEMVVDWSGPGGDEDAIYVYRLGSDKPLYKVSARAKDFKPALVKAPQAAGEYEVKLKSENKILASASFSVISAKANIKILTPIVIAGEPVSIEWNGPRNSGDSLTVGRVGSKEGQSKRPASGSTESPLTLLAPSSAGKYEVRLQDSAGVILASQPFEIR